ncbi:MAG: hypothetical protein AAF492_10900, partial [Verrucomicrobiota bacterium]
LSATPEPIAIPIGETQGFEIRAHYANGSSEDVTSVSTLTNLNPNRASLDGNQGTGLTPGLAAIQVEYAGFTGTIQFVVYDETSSTIRLLNFGDVADDEITLNWFAPPSLGLTNDFSVEFTPRLNNSVWQPLATGLPGRPRGFMDWTGALSTNASRGYLRIRTGP